MENLIRCAGSAPSGANRQPWRFVCVSDLETKRTIRKACESVERKLFESTEHSEMLQDIAPLGLGPEKPFLEDAPWLVVAFRLQRGDRGEKVYYSHTSACLAIGLLLSAIHLSGLVTLTYTPRPMNFLRSILGRPENEVPLMILPVGYPAENCQVPDITRKALTDISDWIE